VQDGLLEAMPKALYRLGKHPAPSEVLHATKGNHQAAGAISLEEPLDGRLVDSLKQGPREGSGRVAFTEAVEKCSNDKIEIILGGLAYLPVLG
jgi:hypothetical protein